MDGIVNICGGRRGWRLDGKVGRHIGCNSSNDIIPRENGVEHCGTNAALDDEQHIGLSPAAIWPIPVIDAIINFV
jgi:hypothetical protein